MYLTQILPYFDPKAMGLFRDYETAVYQAPSAGHGSYRRLGLAALLISGPDCCCSTSRPTTWMSRLAWLEDFVRGCPQAVLIVSHDRAFCAVLPSVWSRCALASCASSLPATTAASSASGGDDVATTCTEKTRRSARPPTWRRRWNSCSPPAAA